ncbi:hypothetical protein BDV96DRAFT_648082 [Lophiotrema nucula]|uniref:Uncharacterized protein n=1 Tax=Lophiotrema nucula TaxID=690887 RepID=A0A6A5Z4B2_9PLEO|nr:hypothetical protein BDV96DRAFT_648082 [Lophiotrema nucula]
MATPYQYSRFESLPAEVLSEIFAHLLHHEHVKHAGSTTRCRGYDFQLQVLRLNRRMYSFAHSYFVKANEWTMLRIDKTPSVNPKRLGIPIFKVHQDTIACAVSIDVLFLQTHNHQSFWRKLCSVGARAVLKLSKNCRNYMVLPSELYTALRWLKLNDYDTRFSNPNAQMSFSYQVILSSAGIMNKFPELETYLDELNPSFQKVTFQSRQGDLVQSPVAAPAAVPITSQCLLLLISLKVLADYYFFIGNRFQLAISTCRYTLSFFMTMPETLEADPHYTDSVKNLILAIMVSNGVNYFLACVRGEIGLNGADARARDRWLMRKWTCWAWCNMEQSSGVPFTRASIQYRFLHLIVQVDRILFPNNRWSRANAAARIRLVPDCHQTFAPKDFAYRYMGDIQPGLLRSRRDPRHQTAVNELMALAKELKPWRWGVNQGAFPSDVRIRKVLGDSEIGRGIKRGNARTVKIIRPTKTEHPRKKYALLVFPWSGNWDGEEARWSLV